jgi:heme iron utilization protein
MDGDTQILLGKILRSQRIASLGTLRDGAPFVSMVAFVMSEELTSLYFHASTLAYHTQDILNDPRCSFLIAETDRDDRDPQSLARVTLRGDAVRISPEAPEYDAARSLYLKKFPESAFLFELGDFALYRMTPISGRFVAGFARAFNISLHELKRTSAVPA